MLANVPEDLRANLSCTDFGAHAFSGGERDILKNFTGAGAGGLGAGGVSAVKGGASHGGFGSGGDSGGAFGWQRQRLAALSVGEPGERYAPDWQGAYALGRGRFGGWWQSQSPTSWRKMWPSEKTSTFRFTYRRLEPSCGFTTTVPVA